MLESMARASAIGERKVIMKGLSDQFITKYGSQDSLLNSARLDEESLVIDIKKALPS